MSDRKIRIMSKKLVGKKAEESISFLSVQNVKSAMLLYKVINSALSNALSKGINTESLYIRSISVDKGKFSKRVFHRSQGRANYIKKKTSCISVYLENN